MTKIAFVFPGQGAQAVGMGQDFYNQTDTAKAVFNTFDAVVENLSNVCFRGPEEELKRTLYTQPAILATSLAALALFQEQCDIKPAVTAGHSLGEYGALVAAGVIDTDTAAKLIQKRASLMEDTKDGAMSAVLGLDGDTVDGVIETLKQSTNGVLTVANYNNEAQVVISGSPEAVAAAEAPLKEAGARRVVPLPVGGAFHSPLMADAASEFKTFLKEFQFNEALIPVVTNVDAKATTASTELIEKLGRQIDSSVRWTHTMTTMVSELGVDTVIEFGPGKVLTGLFKKSQPSVTVHNVFDVASLEATVLALKEASACQV